MTPPNKKDALGKGIRSLLQNMDMDFKNNISVCVNIYIKSKVIEK